MSDDKPPTLVPPVVGRFIPWLQALAAAAIGAFVVAALEVALGILRGAPGPDPWTREGLAHLARAGAAGGLSVMIAYLKQPPAGTRKPWTDEAREAERARLEAQGRLPK